MTNEKQLSGWIVDLIAQKIFAGIITVNGTKITSIKPCAEAADMPFIMPGFVDAHVHVESSMLVPSEFARLAVVHGTVATVSDPHEIANVCGMAGVAFMLQNAQQVNFKFNFGAPSCVPATIFETAGASLDAKDVADLLARPEIKYLSEMMNFPGVLHKDPEVMEKIAAAHAQQKPVDGHAPGLRGEAAKQYIDAGISTDHECFTAEEALDKLQHGMKIIIREGSAAKNFEALVDLINEHAENMLFCSDDKHPDSLLLGHINQLCARAVAKGIDVLKVLRVACLNAVQHYKLDVGLLQENDAADFCVVKDLKDFEVLATYINGEMVAQNGKSLLERKPVELINQFDCQPVKKEDLKIQSTTTKKQMVIEALDGQLITNKLEIDESEFVVAQDALQSNVQHDLLKMVVVNRYHPAPIAKCFVRNFGFKHGAIASSVAHDSHNIIAVGVDDESLARAINLVIAEKGGVSCVDETNEEVLGLPVAGLMSADDAYVVAEKYTSIDAMAKRLGSPLAAPYMTLSFMALLVIPHLKLSDKGLFDGDGFKFV
jgi:adenine deaminase